MPEPDDEAGVEPEPGDPAEAEARLRAVEYVPLDELVPAPRNPKRHDLEGLRASLERFGFTEPGMRDDRTGRLISGHGRAETAARAQAAGLPAPAGVQVLDDGRWALPVITGWSSRDDAEAEAYLIAANRLTERGGWERTALADVLEDLRAGAGLEGTGYAPAELDALLAELAPEAPGSFPEPVVETEHQCPSCGYQW